MKMTGPLDKLGASALGEMLKQDQHDIFRTVSRVVAVRLTGEQ